MNFIHLNVKTDYSILEGINKCEDYLNKCVELKMPALGIANYYNMYGAINFYKQANGKGIKPLIGFEAKTEWGNFIFYAKNYEGYKKLLKLVSLENISKEEILSLKDVIIISCFNKSYFNFCSKEESLNILNLIKSHFVDDYYLEICINKDEDKELVEKVSKFANLYSLNLLATANVHYLNIEDKEIKKSLALMKKKAFNEKEDLSFKTASQINEMFKNFKEAIENSIKIADKCNLIIPTAEFIFPKIENGSEKLKEKIKELAPKKYILNKEIKERIGKEIDIINEMGFSDYFLVVKDIVDFAKLNNIFVGPGRGSAASSIISYILDITKIDPIKYELIFERFLNKKRIKKPDIDIDVCHERREEILKYIKDKYNAAHIVSFGRMTFKLLFVELAKLFKFNIEKLNLNDLKNIKTTDPTLKKIIEYSAKLEGNVWNQSIHASGIVLDKDILMHSPLIPNSFATQYSMEELEYLGLVKIDILGLKQLTFLDNIIKKVEQTLNKSFTLEEIDINDKKTYNLLSKGKSSFIFQLESSTAKKLLIHQAPKNIEELSFILALNRPGPLKTEMFEEYIKGKISYKDLLIYQEQIMKLASDFTGCSLEDSELLIRIMSKKEKNLVKQYEEKFKFEARKNGKEEKEIEKVFNNISKFASYSFNKAHSISYSFLSYYSAYFKANFNSEFCGALIDLDPSLLKTLKEHFNIFHPDVNLSDFNSKIIKNKILLGFRSIKFISKEYISTILENRKNKEYASFEDFIKRNSYLNKTLLKVLIFAGAFDSFGKSRFEYLSSIESNSQLNLFANKNFYTIKKEKEEEINSLNIYLSLYPLNEEEGIVREIKGEKLVVALENEIKEITVNNNNFKVNDIINLGQVIKNKGSYIINSVY